jgi:predicted nucleotidyltransferase
MPMLYAPLLGELVEEARRNDQVVGVLLTGSLARGDALPGTDIDLRFVLSDGLSVSDRRERRDGVLVESSYADEASTRQLIETYPMNVYAYLDGRILDDPQGALGRLRQQAQHRFDSYRTPDDEKSRIAFLLECSHDKIRVAMSGGDLLKAAFATGTASWQIMVGLWAANDRPLPPSSSVRPHLGDLAGPPELEASYRDLFLGDTHQRIKVALELIDWIHEQLT